MADQNYFDNLRNQINTRIKERLSRPTLTDGLQEQNEKQVARKHAWIDEFKEDKATYILMLISAMFTSVLGLLMGLAPARVTTPDGLTGIEFHTDLIHWVIALLYVSSFVTVTEAAFVVAKGKFHTREEGNFTQESTMIIMMLLAGVSIIGTGYAGGQIAASVLGFLSDFKEIPHTAQGWVVKIIPTLLAIYAFLLTAYRLSSKAAKGRRISMQKKREQEEDHKLQMEMVELEAAEQLMLTEILAFQRAVEAGRLSAAEANAARRAGKTLGQVEKEKGIDLDGNGQIGTTNSPAPKSEPVSLQPTHHYSADDLCRRWKKTRLEVGEIFATYNNANHFYSYSEARTDWLPEDMTRENFGQIFEELMFEYSHQPAPVKASKNGKDKANP